ncbi:hypothetical protein ACFLWA_03840 [Chloroflexota bacterium]
MAPKLLPRRYNFDEYPDACYLLFDAPDVGLDQFLANLTEAGLRIIRHGPTYRYAPDGGRYDYFVLLDQVDFEGIDEALKAVVLAYGPQLLASILPSDEPVDQEPRRAARPSLLLDPERRGAVPRYRAPLDPDAPWHARYEELLSSFDRRSVHFQRSRDREREQAATLQSNSARIQDLESSVREAEAQNHLLAARYEKTTDKLKNLTGELVTLRKENQKLRTTLRETERNLQGADRTALDYSQRLQEQSIQLAERDATIQNKDAEFLDWLNDYDREIGKLNTTMRDFDRRIYQLLAEAELVRFETTQAGEPDDSQQLFIDLLKLLLPDIEFLRTSFGTLWYEVSTPLPLLQRIQRLGRPHTRGQRVRGTSKWRKQNAGAWRIYYQKCAQNSRYQVYVSDKNRQTSDIEWLKHQPSC